MAKAIIEVEPGVDDYFTFDVDEVRLYEFTVDGSDSEAHITRGERSVRIRDLTIFPGDFSRWDAIRWGLKGLLRGKK